MIRKIFKVLLKPLMNEGGWLGGSSAPSPEPESQTDKDIKSEALAELRRRRGIVEGVSPSAFGLKRVAGTDTTVTNPAYTEAQQRLADAQKKYDTIHEGILGAQRYQDLERAKEALANTPKTIDIKAPDTYAQMTEAELIAADPNYKRTVEALQAADATIGNITTAIGEISRISGLTETKIQELITKYNDYDEATKTQILALTGATDEQATRLSTQIGNLETLQGDIEKTRAVAEAGVQGALKGEVPEWLQQQINEDVNTEIEATSRRFGAATAGRKGEIATRTKLRYIPQMLGMYEPIATGRATLTRGLAGDVSTLGQQKMGNVYGLAEAKNKLKTQGLKNWENVPQLYQGVAAQKEAVAKGYGGIADIQARNADMWNKLRQGGISNIVDYTRLGG